MMIKPLPLFFIVFTLFSSVKLTAQMPGKKEAWKQVAGSKFVRLDEKSQSINFIQMNKETLYSSKGQAAWLKKSLRFTEKHQVKTLKEEADQKGYTHTKYQICYKDIPVEGSVYTVHSINGRIESASGKYIQGQDISVSPSLSEQDAFDKAVNYIHAKKYLWETDGSPRPEGKLAILPADASYVLTYKFDIYAIEPLTRQYVFVNAHSGEIVKTLSRIHFDNADGIAKTMYNGMVSLKTDSNNGSYRLRETSRGKGIETYNLNHGRAYGSATDFTDADNNWTDTTHYDQAAYDAHFAAEATYDYYYSTFGRNSFDNKGSKIMSYVHYDQNYNNAFWDGQRMTYGDGDGVNFMPFTPIEVVAHEITHGVTEFSADLIYSEESGALNESFSDIFGTVIDFYKHPQTANYLMGEVMSPKHTGFRSMENPNEFRDPDTYKGLFWDPNQEVHNNSGVQNYWFYLLCQGGTGTNDLGNNYSVRAIGMAKAAQVAYRNLTVYLTPSSNYSDARFYSIQSAIDLFGECSPEVMAVTNAWYAVGVGEPFLNSVIADFTTSKMNACDIPAQIRFYNHSVNASSYRWDFGDGKTDTTKNPVHIFNAEGKYIVKLISNGSASCTNTDTIKKTITVTKVQSPISASCTPRTLNPGPGGIYSFQLNTINKTSNGSGDNYQDYTCTDTTTVTEGKKYHIAVKIGISKPENVYAWLDVNNNGKFDDAGELIYQKNKVAKYCSDSLLIPAGAPYNTPLRLRVGTDDAAYPLANACTDSRYGQFQDYTVYVRQNTAAPLVSFSANKKNIITGDTIQFKDQSLNLPVSWSWSFPGGSPSISTLANPKVSYAIPGNYDVTLTVSNTHGTNTITKTGYITVTNPLPLGLSAVIKDQTAGAVDLKWSAINDINIYEDFEDGVANNFSFPDSCFKVENGYLKVYGTANNKWQSARLDKDFNNFVFEYKFQQVQGSHQYSMGSFIRANGSINAKDANGYLINVSPDGFYGVFKLTDSQGTNLIPYKTTSAINTTDKAWNVVTISAIGNVIKIYANGQYVDEFTDDTYASGKIDLDCFFGQPYNYDIRWDYMNVISVETSFAAINMPKAINTIIAAADNTNFREHPLAGVNNQFVEPTGIISQLNNVQPVNALTSYKVYRDSVLLKTTSNTAYTDTLPKFGTYSYYITAKLDDKESNPTNKATVTWQQANSKAGDNCSSAQDLATLTSPYYGTTTGYTHDFNFNSMGSSPDRIFYITVPANYGLIIGPQNAYYDMQYFLRVAGDCPGNTEIASVDQPNEKLTTYTNTTNSDQKVYFIMSGYDGASGDFYLQWKLSPVSKPIAAFTANTTNVMPGTNVFFSNTTKEITSSWYWSFPGGSPASSKAQNPIVKYDTAGAYDVQLIVSNSSGTDTLQKIAYIQVTDHAYCTSNLGGSLECPGDITAVSMKGTTLNNTNHSNCLTNDNSTYAYYPPVGNTTAILKTDTAYQLSVTTLYKDKISVWIDYNQNGSYEASEWTQVSTSSEPDKAATVNVMIPSTALPGETSMRIRTNFYLYPNGAGDACSNFLSGITEDYTVLITPVTKKPVAAFTVKPTAVIDENVQLTDVSTGVPTSWRWSFPGAKPSVSTLQNPVVSYSAAGIYDVKLVVANSLGSDSIVRTKSVTVTLPKKPVVSFMAALTKVITGAQVKFFDLSTNQPTSWKWSFEGGTPSTAATKDASTIYKTAGTYQVKLVASNTAGADSIIKTGYITVITPQKPVVNFYTNTTTTSSGADVCFLDNSANDPTTWRWTFEGATPTTSTEKNPCVKYKTSGTFNVKLTAINAIGADSLTKTGYVTISPAPAPFARFTVNTREEATGTYVHFKDVSSNYPSSWEWTFEGATPATSTKSADSVKYTTPGVYDVKLVVTNESGADSVIQKDYITITVPPKPVAAFKTYVRDVESGNGIIFMDQSQNKPTTVKWLFPGGTPATSNEKSPVVSYSNVGSYDVTLIANNASGSDTITKKKYVVVMPATVPVADFTVSTKNPEVNSDVVFTDYSMGSRSSWKWTFEGATPSTSTEYSPTVKYAKSGTYDVKLVVGNTAGKDSIIRKDYITVKVPPVPIASFTAAKTTILKGTSVDFACNSAYATSWKWTFTGASRTSFNVRYPAVLYNTLGTFDVKLVVSNEAGSDSITQIGYITVVSVLKPVANYYIKGTTVQQGTKLSFVNNSMNSPTSFKWYFPGGTPATSTARSPYVTYNTPGIFDAKLIATNAAGSDSITRQITVINPNFKVDNAVTCPNETVQFTDLTNGNPKSWSWSFPGGTPSSSNLRNPKVVYSDPGAKTITLITNGMFKVTKTNFVVVNEKPKAHITRINNELVSDNPTGNQWYSLTDGIIKDATGQTFTPAEDDSYYLVVTVNGCISANSDTLNYFYNDSKNWSLDDQLNVYPIPVKQFLNIESNSNIESVEVCGIAGNVILEKVNLKSKKYVLDMAPYNPGIYVLKVTYSKDPKIPVFRKIIKSN